MQQFRLYRTPLREVSVAAAWQEESAPLDRSRLICTRSSQGFKGKTGVVSEDVGGVGYPSSRPRLFVRWKTPELNFRLMGSEQGYARGKEVAKEVRQLTIELSAASLPGPQRARANAILISALRFSREFPLCGSISLSGRRFLRRSSLSPPTAGLPFLVRLIEACLYTRVVRLVIPFSAIDATYLQHAVPKVSI